MLILVGGHFFRNRLSVVLWSSTGSSKCAVGACSTASLRIALFIRSLFLRNLSELSQLHVIERVGAKCVFSLPFALSRCSVPEVLSTLLCRARIINAPSFCGIFFESNLNLVSQISKEHQVQCLETQENSAVCRK